MIGLADGRSNFPFYNLGAYELLCEFSNLKEAVFMFV